MGEADAFYKTLLDNLYDGVYFVDAGRVITYWNKAAERLTGFDATEVVGRRCADNVLNHVDADGVLLCTNSCPLTVAMATGLPQSADVFLRHADGHRLPVAVRGSPLVDERGATVGAVEVFSDNSTKMHALDRIRQLELVAYLDPLTELPNRRFGETTLAARFNELQRYGWPFGVVFLDVDNFKRINDAYGHQIGDRVLNMISATMASCVRSSDVVSRWGGEEFLVIAANVTDQNLAQTANKLRALVQQCAIIIDQACIQVTVSGGAAIAELSDTPESLVKRADSLMYLSKSQGRNRISTRLYQPDV